MLFNFILQNTRFNSTAVVLMAVHIQIAEWEQLNENRKCDFPFLLWNTFHSKKCQQLLFGWSYKGGRAGWDMQHIQDRREKCTEFWLKNWRKELFWRPKHRHEGNIKKDLKETEFIWLRKGTTDRLLWTHLECFKLHIMAGISWQVHASHSFHAFDEIYVIMGLYCLSAIS